MSLIPTFVRTRDGKYYKNLVYRGNNWFICFDDNEPVEFVSKLSANIDPNKILKELEWPTYKLGESKLYAGRAFNKSLHEAKCWYIYSNSWKSYEQLFPSPKQDDIYNKVYNTHPNLEGVYYGGIV